MLRRSATTFILSLTLLLGLRFAGAEQAARGAMIPPDNLRTAKSLDEVKAKKPTETSKPTKTDEAKPETKKVAEPAADAKPSSEADAKAATDPKAAESTEAKPAAKKPEGTLPQRWADALHWRSIGPASMGGRIVDLAVCPDDPSLYWVATASGGLLKTKNNGNTFEHQFDHENTVSIGSVAVAPSNKEVVWVGTGEANPRNSVSWGDGVYKSTDGGKTWKNMGLKESFQTGRIFIHPTDENIVYVGALGRLYGPNEQRGLFKTTDGGETWEKVLYVDDQTGVVDVQMNPSDPDTLLVATYERQRDGFDTNAPAKIFGEGGGLHKSTDAGATWKRITEGLPTGKIGRIGIDFYRKDPSHVYIVLESEMIAQEPEDAPYLGIRGEDVDVGAKITKITDDGPAKKTDLKEGDIVVSVDDATVHSYEDLVAEIRKHSAGQTAKFELSRERKSEFVDVTFDKQPEPEKEEDSKEPPKPKTPFSSGLGGQRENVHEQQGTEGHEYGGIYHSTDGGDSWARINSVNPRPMYYSQIRVDPSDNQHIFVLGTSLYRSKDGGKTFTSDGGRDIHVDHHALWIDPSDGRHMILGCDGGLHVTYDRMDHWDHLNHMAIGQFYHVGVGPRLNYRVYGGLQDNGSWGGPSRTRSYEGPINQDWFRVGGGDGFVCLVDENDPDLIYYESQNGSIGRTNLRTGDRGISRPKPPKGTKYRWNWKTPFILSKHNSRIYYTASQFVLRSLDRGNNLKTISPDISRTDRGSATALAQSPLDSEVLYVGTDDGALWATKNGGGEWTKAIDFPDDTKEEETKDEDAPEAEKVAEKDAADTESGAKPEEETGVDELETTSEPAETASDKTEAKSEPPEDNEESRRGTSEEQLIERIMKGDTNGDGKIQESEAPERMRPMFGRIDSNGDGAIDQDELKALAAMIGRRGPQRSEESKPPKNGSNGGNGHGGNGDSAPGPEETTPADQKTESEKVAQTKADEKPTADTDEVKPEDPSPTEAAPVVASDDPLSGEWEALAIIEGMPPDQGQFSLNFTLTAEGKVTGSMVSEMGEGPISDAEFNRETGRLTFTFENEQAAMELTALVGESTMSGDADIGGGIFTFDFEAKRLTTASGADSDAKGEEEVVEAKPLTELLPGPRWVSSLEASRFEEGRAYVTLDGHRSDDDEPYVFVTEDHGETWRSLRSNLPENVGSTKVIREDIENADLLYLGTEFGAWVSLDRGASWTQLSKNFPTVAVHEFAIHPTAGEVVVATHGRSLWVLDATPLRRITKGTPKEAVTLYQPHPAVYWRSDPGRGGEGPRRFAGENPSDGAQIYYSLGKSASSISLEITDPAGKRIREFDVPYEAGLHRVEWDLRKAPPKRRGEQEGESRRQRRRFNRGRLVESGKYLVALTVNEETFVQELRLELDPEHPDYRPWELEDRELELLLEDSTPEEHSQTDSPDI